MTNICWECPLPDGTPTCDPSRARCPKPPLSAEEQERVAEFLVGVATPVPTTTPTTEPPLPTELPVPTTEETLP